ncbi:MAG: hypothetical protein U0271_16450 [Polyangiaceae bacterium]
MSTETPMNRRVPDEPTRRAMKPARWVLFFRTFFLYQLLRFLIINLRMMRMIRLSHGSNVEPGSRTIRAP